MNGGLSQSTFPQYQEQVAVSCDTGYEINGTNPLTCGADQTFGDIPWCQSKNLLQISHRPLLSDNTDNSLS